MLADRLKRRRFLADLLFVAGGLSAAALLGQTADPVEPREPTGFPQFTAVQGMIER